MDGVTYWTELCGNRTEQDAFWVGNVVRYYVMRINEVRFKV